MALKYSILIGIFSALVFVLTACKEPRRTPDGHLMDRPPVSAYGPDDVTTHDTGASDVESEVDEGE